METARIPVILQGNIGTKETNYSAAGFMVCGAS